MHQVANVKVARQHVKGERTGRGWNVPVATGTYGFNADKIIRF